MLLSALKGVVAIGGSRCRSDLVIMGVKSVFLDVEWLVKTVKEDKGEFIETQVIF